MNLRFYHGNWCVFTIILTLHIAAILVFMVAINVYLSWLCHKNIWWCLTSKIQKTDKQNAKKWWNVSTKRNTHHFFWIIENFWNVFFTALKCHLNRILKICKSAQDVKIWNRQRCYCKAVRLWTVWCLSPAQVQPE